MFETIVDILTENAETVPVAITEQTELVSDMGFSSLDVVNLVVRFEDEFNIEIPDKDIRTLKTVGDTPHYIEEHA